MISIRSLNAGWIDDIVFDVAINITFDSHIPFLGNCHKKNCFLIRILIKQMMDHLDCLLITYQSHLRQIQDLMYPPFSDFEEFFRHHLFRSNLDSSRKPPREMRTYSLPKASATDLPIEVLPTPGGPVKHILVTSYHFAILKLNALSFFSPLLTQNDPDLRFSARFRSKLSLE
jgi:hypothetical protein